MTDHVRTANASKLGPAIDRRDLIKIGLGASVAAMSQLADPVRSSAQMDQMTPALGTGPISRPAGLVYESKVGWKNDANRAWGNGPMDDTSRKVVEFVKSFSEANLTSSVLDSLKWTMVDSMAALIAGFESEPARISARLALQHPAGDQKCTVLGYGMTTTPEMAAFANACMLRHCDYNDITRNGPGGHSSDIIPGILAMGEALHSSGTEILVAVALGYEITGANLHGNGCGWDGPLELVATAMAAGKLLGLNEDQLANAISIAIVPHMPMLVSHVGALGMWKGVHSPEAVKCAVWSALLAREGMTGPSKPFEARDGLWDHLGAPKEVRFPTRSDGQLVVENMLYKRYPSEISTQAFLELTPEVRKLTKVEDIASILIEMPFGGWQEIGDPPKWDPRNRETADHSIPYVVVRSLIDGDIYIDSFTRQKYTDPEARRLMALTVVRPNPDFKYGGRARLTVGTKSGTVVMKETFVRGNTPMTHDEIIAKFKRACAYQNVADDQRGLALAQWSDLRTIKDIAEPMKTLAKFGRPRPLSDRTPPKVS